MYLCQHKETHGSMWAVMVEAFEMNDLFSYLKGVKWALMPQIETMPPFINQFPFCSTKCLCSCNTWKWHGATFYCMEKEINCCWRKWEHSNTTGLNVAPFYCVDQPLYSVHYRIGLAVITPLKRNIVKVIPLNRMLFSLTSLPIYVLKQSRSHLLWDR